jgi:hypothetical protein
MKQWNIYVAPTRAKEENRNAGTVRESPVYDRHRTRPFATILLPIIVNTDLTLLCCRVCSVVVSVGYQLDWIERHLRD